MSAPVPIAAIKCQLAAIVSVALDNDALRLPIRAAFRDGLQLLERDGDGLAGGQSVQKIRHISQTAREGAT
jgi:hypothetical protein